MSGVHVLHGISTGFGFFSQIEEATPQTGNRMFSGVPAGHMHPLFLGVNEAKPQISFATTQLATLLANCGVLGANLSAGNTDLYYRGTQQFGTRYSDASLAHMRFRCYQNALLTWSSINAAQGQLARAQCLITPAFDGTNSPIQPAGSVALSGTPAASQYFSLGPIVVNSVAVSGHTRVQIDSGVQVALLNAEGSIYPACVYVDGVAPTITIETYDVSMWDDLTLIGGQATTVTVYLRRFIDSTNGNVAFYANDATQHIKFTGTGMIMPDSGRGSRSQQTIKIALKAADASSSSLTIATAQAIT